MNEQTFLIHKKFQHCLIEEQIVVSNWKPT